MASYLRYLTDHGWLIAGIFGQLFCLIQPLPQIFWDPYHPLFQCEEPTLTVKPGDLMKFVCPDFDLSHNPNPVQSSLFESASLLNFDQEEDYKNCNSTIRNGVLITCRTAFRVSDHFVTEFAPTQATLKFVAGKTYYAIGTSLRTESMLDNRIGGSCNISEESVANKLRLKIRVCNTTELQTGECVPCETEACLYKDCKTNCSNWKLIESFEKENKCFNREERSCTKPLINTLIRENRNILKDCQTACTKWTVSETFQKGEKCYSVEERSCNMILINRVQKEKRQVLQACEKECSHWWSISYFEKNGLCFDMQRRTCNNTFLGVSNITEYREHITGCKIDIPTGSPRRGEDTAEVDKFKIILIVVTLLAFLFGIVLGGCVHRYHYNKKINNNYESSSPTVANHRESRENKAYTDSIILNEIPSYEHKGVTTK